MNSISQPTNSSQTPSSASSTVAPAHSPSASSAGRAPPQAAGTASAKSSYASATKNTFSPTTAGSTSSAVGSIPRNKNDKSPPVNGKVAIPRAVPAVGGPTIVNGNTPTSSTPGKGDHMRKSSVTINTAGAPPNIPNGVSIAGKSSAGSQIKFGQMLDSEGSPRAMNATPSQLDQSGNSLGVNNLANPRIMSPANSPSPIPQPSASGGKPPSHGHSSSVNHVSFGGLGPNINSGVPPGPLAHGAQHLRRESSQSQQNDMGNHGMGPGPGRGGYPPPGGRSRGGYSGPQYSQPMSYSPQPNFRPPPPNQPGGRPNMPFPQQQNRSFGAGAFPHSPHQASRSPVPPNAQLAHPQQGQIAMPNQQMPGSQYPYPNPQYAGYAGMPPHQVDPKFLRASWRKHSGPARDSPTGASGPQNGPPRKNKKGNNGPFSQEHRPQVSVLPSNETLPNIDFSPITGNFEQYLTLNKQGYAMGNGYNPNDPVAYSFQYAHYFNPGYSYPQQSRPPNQIPPGPSQQGPYGGQYGGPQPQPMSRTSSAISGADRPNSSMGKPTPASSTPAPPNNATTANRPSQSPAPPAKNDFKIPQKKSAGIVIRNPNSGDIVDLKKSSASPAPSTKSPAPPSSTAATPPPRTPSHEPAPTRTESKSIKTDEEKRAEMKEAIVAKKQAADKAEEQRKKEEEEEEAKAAEDKKEFDALKEAEGAANAKQLEATKKQIEAQDAEKKIKAEAEEATKAADKAAAGEDEAAKKAREAQEQEDMIIQWEKEEAEKTAKDEERERAYAAKKAAEKEEAARQEAEAFKMADDQLQRLEREAEKAERARLKELGQADAEEDTIAALRKDESSTPTSEVPTAKEAHIETSNAMPAPEATVATPKPTSSGGKPKPAALTLETTKSVEPPQATPQLQALRTARKIYHINDIAYPAPINSPNPALNANAKGNNMRYDRAFLMQFQRAFTEKPSENWADRLKETVGDTSEPQSARAISARGGGPSSMSMSGRQPSNRAPMPVMGAFAQGGRNLPPGSTSQPRFEAASRSGSTPARPTMQNPLAGFVSGRPGAGFPNPSAVKMERGPSSTGMSGHPNSPRNASRGGSSQRGPRANQRREDPKDNKSMPLTAGANLEPIRVTTTGWKPQSVHASMSGPAPGGDGHMTPDVVQRKVKSNLNKMTPNNFDKISGQILAIAHQSKEETDGRSLRQVIQLTFEKATDEAHWAEMYAQFCKRMLESMSSEIKDESILDKKGELVAGGALFRKYLLTRCQTEFEQGWKMNLPEKPEGETKEAVLLSDEYYIAAAAKRRGLGLVRFIGELYKLSMLTERIMHECVKKLVDYESTPDEAEVESLTSLLKTIGGQLDGSEKGHQMMDVYFGRINQMVALPDLPSRLRFMLMDTVDLRKAGWQSKGSGVKGPTTLDAVRQQAAEADRQKEIQRAADNSRSRGGGGGGRPPIGRGDARGMSSSGQNFGMPPPDYHKMVGMDDLRRLGSKGGNRQASSQGPYFGPSSMFSSTRGSNTRKPVTIAQKGDDSGASSRVSTPPAQKEKEKKEEQQAKKSANTFSALASLENAEMAEGGLSPAASPPSSKAQPVSITDRTRSKSPLGKEPERSKEDAETS